MATKPTNMAFSYSIKSVSDNLNLFSPPGTMFDPGIAMTLSGSAKKATVSLDWISIWQ